MKLRYWIYGAAGVIALANMIASVPAVAMSTLPGLKALGGEVLAVTTVARRPHHRSEARNLNRAGSTNKYGSDDAVADPHDSSDPPFGSARWWEDRCCSGGR